MGAINIDPMEEIMRFVVLARSEHFTVTELCEQFGMSQQPGSKYLERNSAHGLKGLQLRSHEQHLTPQRTGTQPRLRFYFPAKAVAR
jgi:hypothetical protein